MHQVARDMNEYEIHQMETTALTVQIPSLPEKEIGPIRQKARTYRKFVKRREKIETTKCHGTSIQV